MHTIPLDTLLTMLAHHVSFAAPIVASATAGGPPKLDGLFNQLFDWLKGVIMVGGGFFLLIDMAKHIFTSPRDLRAAGTDLVVFVILMVVATQSKSIVDWAMSAIS